MIQCAQCTGKHCVSCIMKPNVKHLTKYVKFGEQTIHHIHFSLSSCVIFLSSK